MAKYIALIVVLLVGVGYLIYSSTRSNAEYYVTVAELQTRHSTGPVRVMGVVQPGVSSSEGGLMVKFNLAAAGKSLPVEYRGTLPDIFKPGVQVVAEGEVGQSGIFHATQLQTKCPSKFTASPTPT
ncbi:MAG: cytochrome c maturation protein CcmE [Candidatus Dormibacteraceae bacterium]